MKRLATTDLAADVIVIGGGLAESTTTNMLARKGVRVRLLERDRCPRHHVGGCLFDPVLNFR